jgi:hypothetical protein
MTLLALTALLAAASVTEPSSAPSTGAPPPDVESAGTQTSTPAARAEALRPTASQEPRRNYTLAVGFLIGSSVLLVASLVTAYVGLKLPGFDGVLPLYVSIVGAGLSLVGFIVAAFCAALAPVLPEPVAAVARLLLPRLPSPAAPGAITPLTLALALPPGQ